MIKHLRLMADYSAPGFWGRNGVPLDDTEVPVSAGLKALVAGWVAYFDRSDQHAEHPKLPFDVSRFTLIGYQIAEMLKAELPGWHIEYFDEERVAVVIVQEASDAAV